MLGVYFLFLQLTTLTGRSPLTDSGQIPVSPLGVRGERVFVADGINAVYPVGKGFEIGKVQAVLILGSDSVFVNSRLLPRSAYLLNVQEGKVIFLVHLPELAIVRVVYRYISFSDRRTMLRKEVLRVLEPARGETLITVARVDTIGAEPSGNWTVSGSKSLGFSAGSVSGVGIDQATNLILSGQVEDVFVEAELSDQSTPIPPEGTTRELEELDRIAIAVRGRGWQGNFGDVELGFDGGMFGKVARRTVGAVAKGSLGNFSVTGGYAKPRGEFGSLLLNGIDGVQGPYPLAPDGRAAEIVPGSEKVYLDGKLLVRGWDADYTIDYSTGELIFTNRHLIDHRSRIEAEFQFVTGEYERSGVVAGIGFQPGPFGIELTFFQEGDDPNRMQVLDLSEEEKKLLGALGKDTSRAWLPGGKFVGKGKGDYVQEEGHFRYVGSGRGDYQVRFTLKGDSLGSYVYDDSLLAFRYVGRNQGNYVDSVRVVLPKRQEVGYGKMVFDLGKLRGAVEGALSRRSANLFAQDGASDQGGGLNLNLGWQDTIWGIEYRHRVAGTGFVFPGAKQEVDFSYRWAGSHQEERKKSDEFFVRVAPLNWLEFTGDAGRMEQFSGRELVRVGGRGRIGFLTLDGFKVDNFFRVGATVAPRIFWLFPLSGFVFEEQGRERNRGWDIGVDLKPGERFFGGAGFQLVYFDEKDSLISRWLGSGESRMLNLNWDWSLMERLNLEGVGGYQMRFYYDSTNSNWRRIFGTINTVWNPVLGVRLATDLSQSFRQVQLRDEQFRYVGPGQGQYVRDSITGGYLPSPDGDYERVVVFLGRFAAAQELVWNGMVEFSRYEPLNLSLSFSRNWTRSDTGLLSELFRTDLRAELNSFVPVFSPTAGFSIDRSQDRTLTFTGRGTAHYRAFLEMASGALKELELQGRVERAERTRRLVSGEIDYEEKGWRFSFSPVVGKQLRLEVTLAYEPKELSEPLAYPELGRFRLEAFEGWVARSSSFGKQTKLRIRAGGTYRRASVAVLPWDVELNQPLGLVPEVGVELEQLFSEIFSATGRYNYTDRPGRAAEQELSFELRAFF